MALTTEVRFAISALLTNPLDLAIPAVQLNYPQLFDWSSGTGAEQADKIWHDRRTIAVSTNDDIDLAGGISDPFGATITFARLRLLLLKADDANVQNITVGNAAANPWGAGSTPYGAAATTTRLTPGMMHLFIAQSATGMAVSAGSADVLRLANGAGSEVIYNIVAIGCSA